MMSSWGTARLDVGSSPIAFLMEEEFTMHATAMRTLVVMAAVSFAVSGAMGAERMVVNEHFTNIY